MSSALVLDVQRLGCAYGARPLFSELSLRITGGQVLVIAGANGSGKSTLIRVLCGLQRPQRGEVRWWRDGVMRAPAAASGWIGWVAPDVQLYRELTAHENLEFFARVRGMPRHPAALDALLDDVGLGGRGDDRLAAYSSGMQQRLRYACALLHDPPFLLLDEPTVTLDARGADIVARLIAARRRHGIIVIATNDPREEQYADVIIRLGQAAR